MLAEELLPSVSHVSNETEPIPEKSYVDQEDSDLEEVEEQQAPPSNLAEAIQQHLRAEEKEALKRSLMKQSVVKCSIEKDFAHLFEESGRKPRRSIMKLDQESKKVYMEVSDKEQQICKWLDAPGERAALAELPFHSYGHLLQILDVKVEGLCIVVTNYHKYFAQILDDLSVGRKAPIQWACLASAQPIDIKSKILEMYELKKLKLLLLTPELFQNEEYHHFECELLLFASVQTYHQNQELQTKIVERVTYNRVLSCYEYLPLKFTKSLDYKMLQDQPTMEHHLVVRCENKQKTLVSYFNKIKFSKTIIIVPDRNSAATLSRQLGLQSFKTLNLCEHIPKKLMDNFCAPNLLTKRLKNQQALVGLLIKTSQAKIVVSTYFDALKLIHFDLVVNYTLTTVDQHMQKAVLGTSACALLADDDFCLARNRISSNEVDKVTFEKVLTDLLEKPRERTIFKRISTNSNKFFSQTYDETMFRKFSVEKQDYGIPTSDVKNIRVSKYSNEFDITRTQLTCLLEVLTELHLIEPLKQMSFQCRINQNDVTNFKSVFPECPVTLSKVNLLNMTNQLGISTKEILAKMQKHKIRYTVTEEVLPFHVLGSKSEQTLQMVQFTYERRIQARIYDLDSAYCLYEKLALPNLEFLRRGAPSRKNQFVKVLKQLKEGKYQLETNSLPYAKISNLREQAYHQKTIEDWLNKVLSQEKVSLNQIVQFLQGTNVTLKLAKYQSDLVFKAYQKYRYEDIYELVKRLTGNKRYKVV